MDNHKVIITPPSRPPTAQEAAKAIYGVSANELVRAILNNEGGKYDKLYTKPGVVTPTT